MLLKWRFTLAQSTSQSAPQSHPGRRRRSGTRFRPRLECLEDRHLPSAGALDLGFGSSGKVGTTFQGSLDNAAQATAIQSDGKIVAVGSVTTTATQMDFALVRYNPGGSLDATFGSGGRVSTDFAGGNDNGLGVAIQADGRIVVVGSAATNSGNSDTDVALARYNIDGTLDLSFGNGGKVTTNLGTTGDRATAVAIQTDQSIVVAGTDNDQNFAVVRYKPAGTLDVIFGSGGTVLTAVAGSNSFASSLVIQPDGKIVVAGTATVAGLQRFAVVRYTTTGGLDSPSWGGSGIVTTSIGPSPSSAAAVGLAFGGNIVVAGTVGNFGSRDFEVVEYDSSGNMNFGGFNPSLGFVVTDINNGSDDIASGLVVQPDGKIVVTGSAGNLGQQDFAAVRYTTAGSLDTTFNSNGIVTTNLLGQTGQANAIALQTTGELVVAGTTSSNTQDFALVRYDTSGGLDSSFNGIGKTFTDFTGPTNASADGVALQADGKIVVAGTVSGEFALARYNTDGSLDATFGSGGRAFTQFSQPAVAAGIVLQPDGRIIVAGSSAGAVSSGFALARYKMDGGLDPTFGSGGLVTTTFGVNGASGAAVALQADGKIVEVGVAFVGTQDFAVARYNPDGSPDSSFGGGSGQVTTDFSGNNDAASAVLIQPDGRIVVVGSTSDISLSNQDFALVRYLPDGTTDGSFGPNGRVTTDLSPQDGATGVALQLDGKIVVVGTANPSGAPAFAVLRYNVNGILDASFGTGGSVTTAFAGFQAAASGVVLQSDGKMVVVGSTGVSGVSGSFALARYNPNGSLDASFGSGGQVTTNFFGQADDASALALQANGSIVVVGSATNGGLLEFGLARYLGDVSIVVDLAATTAQALEAGLVPGVFTITRSGDTATPVTIYYTVSGTAQAGIDYSPLNGIVMLASGVTTASLAVTPLDNASGTRNDTITVSLSSGPPPGVVAVGPAYALGAPVTGTVTLVRNPLKIYVVALYRDVLARLSDAPGRSFWVGQLTAGASREQVASGFWLSPEHRGMVVDQFYTALLHRPADAPGRNFWVNYLLTGGSESDVVVAFVTSPECTAAHAANAAFVQGLYTDILQRPGSEAEVAFWEQLLQQGIASRPALANFFLSSDEALRDALDQDYEEFLGRAPDPVGQRAFMTAIESDQATPRLIIADVLGSDEYFARVQMLALS
jgi:uncharacterized delta-60 repeat protein